MWNKKLESIFDLYCGQEIIAAGMSSKTREGYINTKKLAVSYFGDVDIDAIRSEDIRGFFEHLSSWQKPDTVRGNIVNLRSVLKYCARKGIVDIDIEDIKIPKRQKRSVEYLTEPEVMEFISVVGQRRKGYAEINRVRNIAIVELLYATGIRVGELCAMNRNSIRERQFTVVGKSKNPRICFITRRVEESLNQYLGMREDNERALFVSNQNGKRITAGTVRRVFAFACSRSSFNGVHPHTLRHSFATKMLDKGVDMRYIAELMGHESLDTTRIYTHFSNPKLREIYEEANR